MVSVVSGAQQILRSLTSSLEGTLGCKPSASGYEVRFFQAPPLTVTPSWSILLGTTTMICTQCKEDKLETSFASIQGKYRRKVCTSCRRRNRYKNNPREVLDYEKRSRERNPYPYLLKNYKSKDKQRGHTGNDLDLDFLKSCLAQPCTYCGETRLQMTLDRIDNHAAHSRSNVLPACIRCNLLRGDMPFPAWESLVPAVRATRIQGLFGSWGSESIRKRGIMKQKIMPVEDGPTVKRYGGVTQPVE